MLTFFTILAIAIKWGIANEVPPPSTEASGAPACTSKNGVCDSGISLLQTTKLQRKVQMTNTGTQQPVATYQMHQTESDEDNNNDNNEGNNNNNNNNNNEDNNNNNNNNNAG